MSLQQYIIIGSAIFALWLFFMIVPVGIWITAVFSGVKINLLDMVFMRFRKVPAKLIARTLILGVKAGVKDLNSGLLETHFLASGNLTKVMKALIVADKANIAMSFQQATAIDLAGRDVLEAVQISVTPFLISVPSITGISGDGIQLIAEARVTVRTNISQLVGGAGEDTIKARVGQGIISCIGEASDYKTNLAQPEKISRTVLSNGLDAGTAFEILSIDIADITLGKNIGAILQTDQAAADLEVAKAKAEKRRAMAVALEQEMLAKIQEANALVIEAETALPPALSNAFRKGQVYGER
ncbi:MAG: flotillin-like protein FloA [Cyclobacteriaceae bacterium]